MIWNQIMMKHWNRWVFASLSKFFDDRKQGLTLYFENEDAPADQQSTFVQLRYNGPAYRQVTKLEWRLRIIVNFLISAVKNDNDTHLIFRMCGVFEDACEDCIPIMKYGDGPDDNPAIQFATLLRMKNAGKEIDVNHFGQIAPDIRVLQSTVEAHYEATINLDTPI